MQCNATAAAARLSLYLKFFFAFFSFVTQPIHLMGGDCSLMLAFAAQLKSIYICGLDAKDMWLLTLHHTMTSLIWGM